jgi:PKD repeat protein
VVFADSLLLEATSNFPAGAVTTADTIQFGFIAQSCDIDYPAVLGDSVKVRILWEMNDPGDNTYSLAAPRFRYTTPGDYLVNLTVTYPAWAVSRQAQLEFTVTP